MRKLLVRLFNLIYIAAAGVSIYFLATRPIIQTTAKVNLTGEQVSKVLEPLLNGGSSSGSSERAITRVEEGEGGSGGGSITSYLTPEKIAKAFENGVKTDIVIKIDAQRAYQLNNPNVIKEVITDNMYTVIDGLLDITVPPLRALILDVAGDFAKDALKQAITEQLHQIVGEDSSVSNEQVNEMYENIYELLDGDGGVNVSDLTDVILNGKEKEDGTYSTGAIEIMNQTPRYVQADPQPATIVEGDEYYYKDSEDKYVLATVSEPGTPPYYVIKPYTAEEVDQERIEEVMTQALEEVPGLVTKNYTLVEKDSELEAKVVATIKSDTYFVKTSSDPEEYAYATSWSPSEEYYESIYVACEDSEIPAIMEHPEKYYYKDGDKYVVGNVYQEGVQYYKFYKYHPSTPTEGQITSSIKSKTYFWKIDEEHYENVTHWDPEKDYYSYEVKVNDIDTALTYLITQYYLGGDSSGKESEEGGSRAIVREGEALNSTQSEAELREAIRSLILQKIPLDRIVALNDQFGKYVPYALLGVIVLFALPWGWFALISLIRTFRKNKCWTRPRVILLGAFIQLILGIVLTYGLQYALPLIASKVPQVKTVTDIVSIDIRFSCLIASFIYLGVFVMSIFYWIIARKVKVEYKFDKQLARYEAQQARRNRRAH